jgi:poly(3-hydroxybutyrate) depolymerase
VDVTVTKLPTNVPNELPAATGPQPGDGKAPPIETRDLKLPEFANKCRIYVPASHETGQPQAAILWLQGPNENANDIIVAWQSICDRDGIILVIPSPTGKDQWERPEREYLRRLAEHLIAQYKIDPHRMVVCGNGKGGGIAWPLGLASRDIFHGIITAAAPLPRPLRVPPSEPSQRFAIFAALPSSKDSATPTSTGLRKFTEGGYNVTTITTASPTSQLTDDERNQIARWIDTLDRF